MRRRLFQILLILLTTLSLFLLNFSLIAWPLSYTHPKFNHSEKMDVPFYQLQYSAGLASGTLEIRYTRSAGTLTPDAGMLPAYGPNSFLHHLGIKFMIFAGRSNFVDQKALDLDVPLYLLALLAAIPSALGIFLLAHYRRPQPGLCPKCHYDLRAHAPGQHCPECGTLIAPPPPAC